MREITTHRVNVANTALNVIVHDEPGSGGAHHVYEINGYNPESNHALKGAWGITGTCSSCLIAFQDGPIKEAGVNGVTHEALLAVLIDRLECFQNGPYANQYNAAALVSLRNARATLHARTVEREMRGVEGTHQI